MKELRELIVNPQKGYRRKLMNSRVSCPVPGVNFPMISHTSGVYRVQGRVLKFFDEGKKDQWFKLKMSRPGLVNKNNRR